MKYKYYEKIVVYSTIPTKLKKTHKKLKKTLDKKGKTHYNTPHKHGSG